MSESSARPSLACTDNRGVSAAPESHIAHYENFPVASWLCPPRLRAPIAAIYRFARTADDIADEGDAGADKRLAALAAYRAELALAFQQVQTAAAPSPPDPTRQRWPDVFTSLSVAIHSFDIPEAPLAALLSAFVQDVEKTRDGAGYADRSELLQYCARSANPIGRLLLHLYGLREADEPAAFEQSDAICSALQLINFWQDASRDLPRGRLYFPSADCVRHGLAAHDLLTAQRAAASAMPAEALRLVADEVDWARQLMRQGAPLVRRLAGRTGWELRLVVQGGLLVLDKIERLDFDTLHWRPTVGPVDLPLLLVRALRM